MSEKGFDVCIFPTSDPHGSEYIDSYYKIREYLSGFTGSAGTLVVTKDEAALFVDGRYHIQADKETEGTCISVYKLGLKDVPSYIRYIASKVSGDDTVAFDGRLLMQSEYRRILKATDAKICIDDDIVSEIFTERKKISGSTVILLDEEISGQNASSKIDNVREYIVKHKADGLLLSSLDDICYTFNIRGRDIAYSTVAYSYAYITNDSATLFLKADAISESFTAELEKQGIFVSDYSDIELELFKIKGKKILTDPEYTSAYFYKVLGLGNEIYDVKNYEIIRKHLKNTTEQCLARNYHVTDAVNMIEGIVKIKELISSGVELNEYEAAQIIDDMRKRSEGFFALSFETISAYGENAAVVHYSPLPSSSQIIKNRGLLLIDSGAHHMGATTDITRTIAVGEISEEERKAFTLVLKGNLKLMDSVFIKGTRCENLDILARESLWKQGLDYRHGTGHGVGAFLNVHEGPYRIGYAIRKEMPQPDILPGMIISDEPGYYEAGKFGIRHETQLLCINKETTDYGDFYCFEPLSLVPFEKRAIDFSMLTSEELDILKRYSKLIRDKVLSHLSEKAKIWLIEETDYVDETI